MHGNRTIGSRLRAAPDNRAPDPEEQDRLSALYLPVVIIVIAAAAGIAGVHIAKGHLGGLPATGFAVATVTASLALLRRRHLAAAALLITLGIVGGIAPDIVAGIMGIHDITL